MSDSSDDMEFYSGGCDDDGEDDYEDLLQQRDLLLKQLSIATKALEIYCETLRYNGSDIAKRALAEIKSCK